MHLLGFMKIYTKKLGTATNISELYFNYVVVIKVMLDCQII
jgi:hypothetical protein